MKLEQTSENPSTLPNPSIISIDIMPRKVVDLTASSSPAQSQLLMGLPLRNATDFARLDRLRRTLSSIYRLSVEASTLVRTLLLIPKSGTRHGRDDDEDEDEDDSRDKDEDENETEEEKATTVPLLVSERFQSD